MAQVAGRAGRKYKRGLVILQTKSAEVACDISGNQQRLPRNV